MTHPTIEPYPHLVEVYSDGQVLARTRRGLLHRHGYAPDIFIPAGDVIAPLHALADQPNSYALLAHGTPRIAWTDPAHPELEGHFAFDFNRIRLDVDGAQVRGHVRDPYKVITVTPVSGRLQMMVGDSVVVDSTAALKLRETGLPARYYVPTKDVNAAFLEPSDRQTVCTYKGEATYHHLRTPEGQKDNVIWCYATPWTDFAADIGRIAGHFGLYASAFDSITLDGSVVPPSSEDAKADRDMIAKPTVDDVLKNKLPG